MCSKGLTINPYNSCVVSFMINSGQMTITFHVDDPKISYQDPTEVDRIIDWFKSVYLEDVQVSKGG